MLLLSLLLSELLAMSTLTLRAMGSECLVLMLEEYFAVACSLLSLKCSTMVFDGCRGQMISNLDRSRKGWGFVRLRWGSNAARLRPEESIIR